MLSFLFLWCWWLFTKVPTDALLGMLDVNMIGKLAIDVPHPCFVSTLAEIESEGPWLVVWSSDLTQVDHLPTCIRNNTCAKPLIGQIGASEGIHLPGVFDWFPCMLD